MNSWVLRAIGSVAGIVSAVAYSSFLFGPAAHSHLPVASSFISELEADGQPYAGLFRLSDIISGLLIVALAAVLYQLVPRERALSVGCLLTAAMGLASVADGATTMGCAPSLDAACAQKDSTVLGLLSQTFESHTLSGLAGFLGGAGGMFLIGIAVRRSSPVWGGASVWLACALGAVGVLDLVLLAINHWFGVAERARPLLVSLWLLGTACYLVVGSSTTSLRRSARSAAAR